MNSNVVYTPEEVASLDNDLCLAEKEDLASIAKVESEVKKARSRL